MKTTPPTRWNLHNAAREFGIDRRTLDKRLADSSAKPDEAGTYSTRQITAAIFGDLAGEKLRKMRADADMAEMARDRMDEKVIDLELAEWLLTEVLVTLRGRILGLDSLTKADKNKLLEILRAPTTEAELVAAQREFDAGRIRPIEE